MFKRMEIAEQVYEGKSPKKIIRADSNRGSHVIKKMVEKPRRLPNTEKGRSGKRKTKNAVSLSEKTNSAEKYAYCMALDTPLRSVKYLKNILKSMLHSGPKKIKNLAPAAKQSVVSLSSLTAESRRLT